ncbi:MAG: HAMP domain-containing sensor histidine kinase [Planctomycetota bacterium]
MPKKNETAGPREAEDVRLRQLGHAHAHLSHEVRRILVTIGMLARTLAGSDGLSDEDRETVEKIIEQETAGEELLDDVLELVTPTEGEREPEPIEPLLEDVGRALEPHASGAEVDLRVEPCDARACRVPAIRKKLRQAFLNLGHNAIDAMADGGGSLVLTCRAGPRAVAVRVADTGPGMRPEETQRMFEPFQTSKEGGTGLGLALTRKIVEDHGGEIEIDSRPGEGTTVTVTLPRAGATGGSD